MIAINEHVLICLFDFFAAFVCRCQRNLWLCCLATCSAHSAAAACQACERTRRGGRQDGATEPSRRPCCRRRAGSCSAGRCSRCRFEFSCRTSRRCRSDADMTALLPLPTRAPVLIHYTCTLCMLLCRCGACLRLSCCARGLCRQACLRAVRSSAVKLQGKAVRLPAWQVLSALL